MSIPARPTSGHRFRQSAGAGPAFMADHFIGVQAGVPIHGVDGTGIMFPGTEDLEAGMGPEADRRLGITAPARGTGRVADPAPGVASPAWGVPDMSSPMPRASGLIVAGGSSRRMGFDKTTAILSGRPLVCWSLEAFEACDDIGPCALVCAASRLEEFTALAAPYKKFRWIVPGGAERADSVRNGLLALASESPALVAVHDAARPLVTPALISMVITSAVECGAAVAAEPVGDSLHRADQSSRLVETVPREGVWAMQTPQVAKLATLLNAMDVARPSGAGLTDEMAALIRIGLQPQAVFHGALNFKVTFPRDLDLAQAVIDLRRRH